MAERVHPISAVDSDVDADEPSMSSDPLLHDLSASSNPAPPGTYVFHVPKDLIYRMPSPENARLFEAYTRRAQRPKRRLRSCFICISITCLLILVSLAAIFGTLFLIAKPKLPTYTVTKISITSMNVTNSRPVSAVVTATVRAENPNKKIGIRYMDGSSVDVGYDGVELAQGEWPVFLQGKQNVTEFVVKLRGAGVRLAGDVVGELVKDQRRNEVPLRLDVRVPVRVEFGVLRSWTFRVQVRCEIVVDRLTKDSKIVSKNCKSKVHL